jgi:uncharacterized membrane protein YfcA
MEPTELVLFLVLALLAEVLGTVGGFGSSLFFVPIAGLFFEFHVALAITGLFHITSNMSKVALFHKGIVWNSVLYLGAASVVSVLLGAWLSTKFDGKILKIILGVFLIALSTLFLIKKDVALKPAKGSLVLGGLSSGFAAGLFGTGGAIRGLVLASFGLGKDAFIATSALIDLGVDLSRTGIYFYEGYFNSVSMPLMLWLIGVSALGSYLGKLILAKISEQQFRQVVLWLILGVGIFTVAALFINN